jgi:hypothetical protein
MIQNMADLRKAVRRPLGIGGPLGDDPSVRSDAAIDVWLNESYAALLEKYAFREKEVVATLPTVAGVRNYTMPDPHDGLRQIDILNPVSSQHIPLIKMSVVDYTAKWNESTDQQAFPTNYVRESCLFRLWPTPDAVYTLTVRYWGILADLDNQNNTIDIPNVWTEPIKMGAITRGWMDLGDLTRAQGYAAWQSKLIEDITPIETKEEEDYHQAGLEVLGLDYRYNG